ncbi:MAG: patatin-like phospholipase family protein, partial [bacterium]
ARGWAHIGVLRRLMREGIEPDIVCGTSIGALVGGAWLAGRLDALEEWARSLSKRRLLGYLDVMAGGNSLLRGRRLERLMEEHMGWARIETLPKPFVTVTSDLATGHEVWIESGPLTSGIRASYALPGIFSPLNIDGRWLIDGALVNPVPVSVCRAKGAHLVIAVSLHQDSFGKINAAHTDDLGFEDVLEQSKRWRRRKSAPSPQRVVMRQLFAGGHQAPGFGTVMLGALNIIMDRLSRSRMAGDPADVLVVPRTGHIGLVEFDRAAELITLGEEAVAAQLPLIRESMIALGCPPKPAVRPLPDETVRAAGSGP